MPPAGLSADYYVRLEQGRERNPSAQVLEALSRVPQLDDDARLHLFRIAGLGPRNQLSAGPEHVDAQLLRLMRMWPDNPALVRGRAYGNRGRQHGRRLPCTARNVSSGSPNQRGPGHHADAQRGILRTCGSITTLEASGSRPSGSRTLK